MCCVEKHGVLSPMRSGKLNWTQLNSTELDRSVQLSSVFHCALNRRRVETTVAGSWQSRTDDGRRQSSQLVAGCRPTTDIALIGRFTNVFRLWRTCDDRRFRRRIVAGRRRFNAQREAELNWTVQLSSVSRYALGLNKCEKGTETSILLTTTLADWVGLA